MDRDICYFDGLCGMCRRTTRMLRSLDWQNRLVFEDFTKLDAAQMPVLYEQAMLGMPLRTVDGRVLVGYPAIRRALMQTPLGALVAWILYLPGVSWIGRRVYNWVARNRKRACEITPSGAAPNAPSV